MATCLGDTYVELIERTECIGNSLAKINSNFAALDIKVCESENTTLALNSLQGIIKGNGSGEFDVADPDYDYYIPGRVLQTDFNITGSVNCGGNITIGGAGKNLSIPGGNISCIDINLSGKGTFTGAIKTFSSLDVGERASIGGHLTSRTLTVADAAVLSTTLTVGGSMTTGGSLVATTFVTAPVVNGTVINATTINATTLNLDQPNAVTTMATQYVNNSRVDSLTAFGGKFFGERIEATYGKFDNLQLSNVSVIPSLSTIVLSCPLINGTILNANILNVNDAGGSVGTITTNQINANGVNLKSLNVSNVVNGNNIGTITAAIGNITNIAATDVTGAIVRANGQFVGPIGNIDVLTTTTGNITTVAATTVNATGAISGKQLSITGTNGNEGTISASVSITAPTINATGSNGVTTPKLTVTGTTDAIILNAVGSQIVMDRTSSIINMTGLNSEIKLNSGTITASKVYATSEINCKGDIIAFGALSDKRLKKNVTKIENSLDKVCSLRGVTYDWDTELQNLYNGEDVGVIAQEVEKVLPQAICNRESGYKAVKYEKLIPLLIEAVKELKDQNIALQQEIEALKNK